MLFIEECYIKERVSGSVPKYPLRGQGLQKGPYLTLVDQNIKIYLDNIFDVLTCDTCTSLVISLIFDRFIYSWKKIPSQYFNPDISLIDEIILKNWLTENIPSSKDTG